MAKKGSRAGRTLIIFGLVIVAMYVALAIRGQWAPKLGLDLQGGTRITLQATGAGGQDVTPAKLEEAAGIIDSRVNANGVAESEVTTQGNRNIVIEIPGETRRDLVDSVTRTAQLRFRLVAGQPQVGVPQAQPSAQPSASPSGKPAASGKPPAGAGPSTKPAPTAKASPRAGAGNQTSRGAARAAEPSPSARPTRATPSAKASSPSAEPSPSGTSSASAAPNPKAPVTDESTPEELLAWAAKPNQAALRAYQRFTCPADGTPPQVDDAAAEVLVTCDENGLKYLLSPAVIEGTSLTDANFGQPQNGVGWEVTLGFDGDATKTFATVSRALVGNGGQFAIVLDGEVLSAPTVNEPILDGRASISGDFTQSEARSLANSLKYGALPLTFTAPVVTEEGPTLAADQLDAGLLAGAIGLALVLVYCMLYYRGLGLVVMASLFVAAAITYAVVLFLGNVANFTLTLPGIAGLIVGIGITADSFIVYFERIRDEMREGRSMRVAVEAGWARARNTCLAADAVSMLAAVVLYVFAIGVVKGFAFALGVSTVIDVVVFFFFTHPMVTWLARFRFFSSGHPLSGLSPASIGIERIGTPRPAAARAASTGGASR